MKLPNLYLDVLNVISLINQISINVCLHVWKMSSYVGKRLWMSPKVSISRKTSSDICKTSEMSVFVRNVVFYLTGLFKRTKIRLFRYWPWSWRRRNINKQHTWSFFWRHWKLKPSPSQFDAKRSQSNPANPTTSNINRPVLRVPSTPNQGSGVALAPLYCMLRSWV